VKWFIALILFVVAVPAYAQTNGTYSDGYVYQDGYWYLGKQAYTRASVPYSYQAYDSYGRCYRTYTAYKWAYTAYVAPAVTYKDPDYRTKLLAIAQERDRFIMNQRKDAIEQNNFIETVRELGLNGNFNVRGYGNEVAYANPLRIGGSYSYGVANYGNPGATAYTYSYNSLTDIYGKSDPSVLQNQYARSVENTGTLHERALTGLGDIVKLDATTRERILTKMINGQIAERLMLAMDTPTTKTQTTITETGTGTLPVSPSPENKTGLLGFANLADQFRRQALLVTNGKCIACHGKDNPKGGLDLTDPFALTIEEQRSIVTRARHADPSKRMPLSDSGAPGEPLTNAELRALMNAFEN
jgi:hypothetical protein